MGTESSTLMRATVVVCTRNRSRALADSCAAVLAQSSTFPWELLVVDNGSTDDTLAVAREVAGREPERVRVVVEPTLGLSAARNCGVRLARGEWIAFLDDDAIPGEGWLRAYDDLFGSAGPLAAGGPVEADLSGARPAWLDDLYLGYLSAWDRGPLRHELHYSDHPRGANMAFRREAFALVGEFDPRLGRRGRSLRSCEEIELCLRLERSGAAVIYEPAARVRHRIQLDRLSEPWMLGRFGAQGFSEAIVDYKHFGLKGTRRGVEEHRQALGSSSSPGLLARCRREAYRSYRLGAAYSVLCVPRWSTPK